MGEAITYRDAAVQAAPPPVERSRRGREEQDTLLWRQELGWFVGSSLALPGIYLAWRMGSPGWMFLGPIASFLLLLFVRSLLRLPHAWAPVRTTMEGRLRSGLGGTRFEGSDGRLYLLRLALDEAIPIHGPAEATVIRPLSIVVAWKSTVPRTRATQQRLDQLYGTSPAERDVLFAGRVLERLERERRRTLWWDLVASLLGGSMSVGALAITGNLGATVSAILAVLFIVVHSGHQLLRENTVEVFEVSHHPLLGWQGPRIPMESRPRRMIDLSAALRVCVFQPEGRVVAMEVLREDAPLRPPEPREVRAFLDDFRADFR